MPPLRHEARTLATLALPIVLANLGAMMLGVVDLKMLGRFSTDALAAAALGNVWIHGTILFGMGVVMGIDPIISQAHGARDGERCGLTLQRGLVVGLIVSVFVAILWAFTEQFLVFADQDPELAKQAHEYTIVQIPSIPFYMSFIALRQYLQGREIMRPALIVTIVANVFNVVFNELFIFGGLGIEGFGLVGAGAATASSRVVMLMGLALITWKLELYKDAWSGWSRRAFEWPGLKEVSKHGLAVGLHLALEVWAFSAASLMAGRLSYEARSPEIIAAHVVVLNIASVSFMLPMGISFGAVTRVGNLIGAQEHARAQRAAWVAFGMGGFVMLVCGVILFAFRHTLPRFYHVEGETLAICATILPIAATFQVFDGLQVVGSGILRGMGKTVAAAWINFVGYWILALPLAWWMAFMGGFGLRGVWWGLAIGLALVAGMLIFRVKVRGPARMAAIGHATS